MKNFQLTPLLLLFWVLLTASLDPFNLALGLGLALLVGFWAGRFLWAGESPLPKLARLFPLIRFFLRLLGDIVAAAFQVAGVVLHPRMPVNPLIIRHQIAFNREISRIAFANSISLTPGAHTVDVDDDLFVIHCLAPRFAEQISSGELERRIAAVFEGGA